MAVRRFTVEEYHRLAEIGLLTENDRVELLEGWIVPKMVHNPPHDNAIELLDEALRAILPGDFRVRIQSSITTADSEPEPDVAVIRGSPRQRRGRNPRPDDVALVVEVADSSLETDRTTKARLYARADISTYWILNLGERTLEILTGPTGPVTDAGYSTKQLAESGETVAVVIGGVTIGHVDLDDVLP